MNGDCEELYVACMKFCTVLTHFLFKKQDYDNYKLFGCRDEYELERAMDFERRRLISSFNRLKELINKVDES